MNETVIHMGLHKAGSSFLQKNIFPKIKEIELFDIGDFNFYTEFSKEKINLISAEGLSSRPFPKANRTDSCFVIANRIAKVFPNAKIILILRKKEELLKSWYSEYIKHGGILNYEDWFESWNNYDVLRFEEYISELDRLFSSLLVLNFEDLKKNSDKFVNDICNYIGVESPKFSNKIVNKKLNEKTLKRWRKANLLFKSSYNPSGPIPFRLLYEFEKLQRKKL